MVETAPVSSPPPTLQARPPTPPRESNQNITKPGLFERLLQSSAGRRSSASVSLTFTPDSSAESPNTSGSLRKKVGFSDWPQYKDPPTVSFDGKGVLEYAVQPLLPSAKRKPTKSILKAHNENREHESIGVEGSDTTLLPLHHYASFEKMLKSIVQQLTGKDRSSKVDAYLMLSGSLKASENVPDMKALKDQMGLLCQSIERDLAQKLDNGKPDSSLIVNALTVLGCFLHKASIAECFPTDFTLRFVDHAIKVFEDGSMSKEVTKHLMFILAQQKFSLRVMSQERVGRLLMALHTIEERMPGKSIVQGRLQIYRTLLRQSRSHLSVHTIWIEDLLTDMLSSLKDIRASAITFGLEAGVSLGFEHNVSRAVQNVFKKEQPGGDKFADYYVERLKTSIKNKTETATIPQIWSVVILLLRSKPQLLEQWQFFPSFLSVLTACFNIADNSTRTEAHYAWNRFIFAVRPNEKTSPKMRAILFQGLSSQLTRKSSSGRKKTMSSIYVLLYYALNPISQHTELDMYWDEYLVPLVKDSLLPVKSNTSISEMSKLDAIEACIVLQSLFDTKIPRKWNENRAVENLVQNGMEAKELPALDSKWLRKNHIRVFGLLNPLLQKLYWDLGEDSAITKLWQSYITSIALPAVMEIKVSFDTMSCIASLFGTIHKLWGNGPEDLGVLCNSVPSNKQAAFWKGSETILTTAIHGLGILPFTDKTLSIKHDNFIAVLTPSQQPSKIRLVTKSPLYHLISLLTNSSSILNFDVGFTQMASGVLAPFFENKASKQAQIDFVKELTVLLPTDATPPVKYIWQVLAEFAIKATDLREKVVSNALSDVPLGNDYRRVVNILEIGVVLSPQRPLPRWRILFDALVVSASLDAGDSGKAIAVLEPIAKTLRSRASVSESGWGLLYLTILLGKVSYPKDRQALEAAERKIWGSKQPSAKGASYDPYNEIYTCTRSCLDSAYRTFAKVHVNGYADMISAITGLFQRCPPQLVYAVLANLQSSIALWIADHQSKLTGGNPLGLAIITLWTMLCKIIPTLPLNRTHTQTLSDFEVLVCAGLESKHKTIVNIAIGMWNTTFGSCEDGLEYPQKVKDALLRFHPVVELQLPFFPESLETEAQSGGHRQPANFLGKHDESSQYSGFSSMGSEINGFLGAQTGPKVMQKTHRSSPQVIVTTRSVSLKRSREETPEASRRQSKRREVTPRLRHNDSQAEFEAIPSSSPGFDRVLDSQLLTERQKEIKERQQTEAAMFPDLRSTPHARNRLPEPEDVEQELPQHRSSSKIREMISRSTDRETTPTAIIPSDDENNYVASSPTPTRSMRTQVEDPPSSPPEAAITHGSPVLDDQISSPLEDSPEPSSALIADAVVDANVLQQIQDPSSLAHEDQAEPKDEVMDDIPADTTEANIQPDDLVLHPKTTLDTVVNTTEIAVVDETTTSTGEEAAATKETTNFDESENDTTSFLEPSAQVVPDAMQLDFTASTNDLPTYHRSSSPTDGPSDQLLASQLEHKAALATANGQNNHQDLSQSSIAKSLGSVPSSIAELAIESIYEPQIPGTPPRATAVDHSPKTPQFVDALSSPLGSEKLDLFEDAVSSPRINVANPPRMHGSSSSLSEMDESSMLRVVAEYDRSSSRRVSFLNDKENQPRRTRSSITKAGQETYSANVSPSVPVRKSALRKRSGLHELSPSEDLVPEADQVQTSSVPSLIPETPAPKAADLANQMNSEVTTYRDDNGVEIDMNETIIVDTSILEQEGGRLAHKRSPRKKSKKRKLLEDATGTSGAADIQGGNSEDGTQSQSSVHTDSNLLATVSASPSKLSAAPAKKKRRGRPTRSSETNAEALSYHDIEGSQSFLSADGDVSIAETDPSMTDDLLMDGNEALETPAENHSNDVGMVDRSSIDDEIVMDTVLPELSTSDAELIAETTFEESSSAEKPSAAVCEPEDQTREEFGIVEVEPEADSPPESDTKALPERMCPNEQCDFVFSEDGVCSGCGTSLEEYGREKQALPIGQSNSIVAVQEMAVTAEDSNDEDVDGVAGGENRDQLWKTKDVILRDTEDMNAEVNSTDEKPVITVQSMKDKLQSLITHLHSAALSRQEINELEDMFMDAKRVLYDAGLRGRQLADV